MNVSQSSKSVLFVFLSAFLVACSGINVPKGDNGPITEPELQADNFYDLLHAEEVPASTANTLLSLGECADNGVITLTGAEFENAEAALADLAHQFRVALARSGSNSYVLQRVEWRHSEQHPGTISAFLQARGLICSA